jgi:hypothetical protein
VTAAIIALVVSVALVAYLLTRQRERLRPEIDPNDPPPPPAARRPTRQEKLLQKLEPLPEIPTVMDLMRAEIEETGVARLPGHEGLAGPVMLKVFRRDAAVRERCTHEGFGFVVRDGVEPEAATEDDVHLYCEQCGNTPIDRSKEDPSTESGTESDPETLQE